MVLSRLYQPWVFCCIRSQLMDVIINAHRKTIEMQVMNGRSKHERKREREREDYNKKYTYAISFNQASNPFVRT